MKLAITGTTGRVGRALADYFSGNHDVLELARRDFDLSDPRSVSQVDDFDFDVLLHPAAMTSLEGCMDAPLLARQVNFEATAMMARSCRKAGRKIVFFSTDYVLGGGEAGLHAEDAPLEPRSVYARTKADAEAAVLAEGGCVMRVSWVFGSERPAFPDQVIARALAREPLAAVVDKTSLPTSTRDLVKWVDAVISAGCPNQVMHACNGGEPVSWHGMAEEIIDCMLERGALHERPELEAQLLTKVQSFRAVRPQHTAMETSRLAALLGIPPRHWRVALREHIAERLISR